MKVKWTFLEDLKGEFDSWFSKEVMGINLERHSWSANEPMIEYEQFLGASQMKQCFARRLRNFPGLVKTGFLQSSTEC